jgi:repressor of nif and glnA expression
MNNTMQILYETVIYKSGIVNKNNVPGFATINYDNSPSPLTVLGGGTNSIFGPGGVVDGVGSVIRNVQSGNILGAILSASNTYNNAKKIKKADVKEELKGIAKEGVLAVGKQAGSITNPVAQFSVGAAVLAGTAALATSRGTADNSDQSNNTVITNATVDNRTFLGADESFNLVSNNTSVRDEIAAALYYRDIGSRKGLTIAESNIEYEASSTNVKNVYTNKAITDVRKLVTEGYIKIIRQTQDVEVATEKANI